MHNEFYNKVDYKALNEKAREELTERQFTKNDLIDFGNYLRMYAGNTFLLFEEWKKTCKQF